MTRSPSAADVLTLIGTPTPRVLIIDGRSGSGKTTLANLLAPALNAHVLHMDDLYRGWGSLTEAPAILVRALSEKRYRRYDWGRGELAESHDLDSSRPLIIEGCGSLTRAALTAAHTFAEEGIERPSARGERSVVSIWLDCPAPVRKRRALTRDGDLFRPHWDTWAEQEEHLLFTECSQELADIRLSSASQCPSELREELGGVCLREAPDQRCND